MLVLPSGSSICSALPWSAVITHAPPADVDGVHHLAQALVDGLRGDDGGRDHAGVADHVGVGEVDHREARMLLGERRVNAVGDSVGAHLRLEVVGGHVALGRDQLAALAGHTERSSPPLKK